MAELAEQGLGEMPNLRIVLDDENLGVWLFGDGLFPSLGARGHRDLAARQ